MPELPNIVRERLKVSSPASAHPDPDVLTAFAERALLESERAAVTEHLARCHDCRDILVLSLPATVTVETVRVPVPVRSSWLRAPVLRWGVVAAGFAVFAVTGMLQFERRHQSENVIARQAATGSESMPMEVGRAADSEKPKPGMPSASVGSSAGSEAAVPASESRVNTEPMDVRNRATSSTKDRAAMPPANEPVAHSGSAAARGQSAAPSSLSEAVSAPGVATNGLDQASGQPLPYEAKAQARDSARGVAGQQPLFDAPVDKAKAPAAASGQAFVAPGSSTAQPAQSFATLWEIGTSGGLLRSFDQGMTWTGVDVTMNQSSADSSAEVATQTRRATQDTKQLQTSTPSLTQSQTLSKSQAVSRQNAATPASIMAFHAVSAAGLEVWAGGSAGMLYHSADGGAQWTRVVLAASGVTSTGDIVSIAFSDSQHGHLATSTQEFWITIDAGHSWQKR